MIRPPIGPIRAGLLAGVLSGAAVVTGCESFRSATPAPAPTGESASAFPRRPGGKLPPLRVANFVFYADVPLSEADPVFRDLEALPEQLQRELRLPAGHALVQVYLFNDQDGYEAFMRARFPHLPKRSAYFLSDPKRPGSADDLQVYTYLGDHIKLNLRHEFTHALLHSVLKGVPMWLDEGLAGFFEQPVENDGVNFRHLDALRRQPGPIDLAHLEKCVEVADMGEAEYREAWAFVHYSLRGDPAAKAVLLDYLQTLRTNATPGPLAPRLRAAGVDAGPAIAQHLQRPVAAARP